MIHLKIDLRRSQVAKEILSGMTGQELFQMAKSYCCYIPCLKTDLGFPVVLKGHERTVIFPRLVQSPVDGCQPRVGRFTG